RRRKEDEQDKQGLQTAHTESFLPASFLLRVRMQLEFYPQTELPPPHLGQACSCERRNLPCSFGINVSIGQALIHVIERIEELSAELSVYLLRDLQPLAQR